MLKENSLSEDHEISSLLLDESKNLRMEHVSLVCPTHLTYCEKEKIFKLYTKFKDTDFFKKRFKGSFTSFVIYLSKRSRQLDYIEKWFAHLEEEFEKNKA